jgi:hypothetical protein
VVHYQSDDGEDENRGNDAHGVETVDTPFLDHIGLEVREESGAGETDLRGLQGEPILFGEGEDRDEGVAKDADDSDGDVDFAGVFGFVEANGREDSVATVIDRAAVKFFGDGAGRCGCGVLIVDAKGEGGVEDAGDGEQSNEKAHLNSYCKSSAGLRRVKLETGAEWGLTAQKPDE